MKIGIISDIHLDINEEYPVLDRIAEVLHEEECTGLLLAGDVSSCAYRTMELLETIRKRIELPLWFVPGNHDMWDEEHKFRDAWEIYEAYKGIEGCLCGKGTEIGENKVLTGSIGWYDYSFGSPQFTEEQFCSKERNGRVWQDRLFARWGKPDREVAAYCLEEMEKAIRGFEGKEITAVTHMLAIPEFTVSTEKKDWDFFNAFLGSAAYGEFYEKRGIARSITGHVHHRMTLEKKGVIHQCACLGYYNEWYTDDVKKEVRDAMQFF